MSKSKLSKFTPQDLISRFRGYALEQQSALLDSNTRRYNQLYDKIQEIMDELRRRGPQAVGSLLTLLDDPNLRVRYEAAIRLVDFAPRAAVAALRQVVESQEMPVAGDAGMALYHIEKRLGKLPT
jgi:HEAT repeat protein